MIKFNLGPDIFGVTDLAALAIAFKVYILFFMTTEATGFDLVFKNMLLVTILAQQRHMPTLEFEVGIFVVIEQHH